MMSPSLTTLYEDVISAIAGVTTERTVLRLDEDTNLYSGPNTHVQRFAEWARHTRRGLCAYAVDQVAPHVAAGWGSLDAFDRDVAPRVSIRAGLEALITTHDKRDEHLTHVVAWERPTGCPSDGDDEARAFAAARFQQLLLPSTLSDVQVFRAGVHELLRIFIAAVGASFNSNAVLLAPVGVEQSHGIALSSGSIDVVDDLTGAVLTEWLTHHRRDRPHAVYVPAVNSFTGQVLTRRRAHDLARVVLRHNQQHRDSPVFVFADDSLIDGCHTEVIEHDIQPIGAVTGSGLGNPALGRMTDWTLTALTPRMAMPTTQIVFTATHNRWLHHVVHQQSTTQHLASPLDELVAAAALCLTPTQWFDTANDHTVQNLRALRDTALNFNTAECGFDGLTVGDNVGGGWHTTLRFDQRLLPTTITSGFDLFDALLQPSAPHSTAIALLPGELYGWQHDPEAIQPCFLLRINLSMPTDAFAEFLWQLQVITTDLWQCAWREQRQAPRPWRASIAIEHEPVG